MHPYYSRTSLWISWLSAIVWWILPVVLIRKHVQITNFVLFKLIELIIIIQFVVTPLSYDSIIDKKCDPDFLLANFNYTGNPFCSDLPENVVNKLNCNIEVLTYLMAPSGFISGLSLYLAYVSFKDIRNLYFKAFIFMQMISFGYWISVFQILMDDSYPCISLVGGINIARIMVVFTPYIIILSMKAYLKQNEDHDIEQVDRRSSIV